MERKEKGAQNSGLEKPTQGAEGTSHVAGRKKLKRDGSFLKRK